MKAVYLIGLMLVSVSQAAILSDSGVFLLPLNCQELLAEPGPFVNFFEAVGRGLVVKDRKLSQRIFKVAALREKVADAVDRNRDQHPIDTLIRKTLCFYREQKEPLKAIPYDDEKFLEYLKGNMSELEKKVSEVVYQFEMDRQERIYYEKRVSENQELITSLKREAEKLAEEDYLKITKRAKAKAKEP